MKLEKVESSGEWLGGASNKLAVEQLEFLWERRKRIDSDWGGEAKTHRKSKTAPLKPKGAAPSRESSP